MTKYYVTEAGAYIGGYDGVEPPIGAIEVPVAPEDARQVWDFSAQAWGPIPPLTDYTLPADLPWTRMVSDEEGELVQDAVDALPAKTRNMINKATSFTTGTDAFSKFKAAIVSVLGQARADAIMGPPLLSELSSAEESI